MLVGQEQSVFRSREPIVWEDAGLGDITCTIATPYGDLRWRWGFTPGLRARGQAVACGWGRCEGRVP